MDGFGRRLAERGVPVDIFQMGQSITIFFDRIFQPFDEPCIGYETLGVGALARRLKRVLHFARIERLLLAQNLA